MAVAVTALVSPKSISCLGTTKLNPNGFRKARPKLGHGFTIMGLPSPGVKGSPCAFFGGGNSGEKGDEKKRFISKEEEPDQYWQTQAEREGLNPMLTPLPYIAIFGLLTPFIILGVAFANGWIKMPVR